VPVASDTPALLYTKYADVGVDQLTKSAQLANYAAREPSCSKAVLACEAVVRPVLLRPRAVLGSRLRPSARFAQSGGLHERLYKLEGNHRRRNKHFTRNLRSARAALSAKPCKVRYDALVTRKCTESVRTDAIAHSPCRLAVCHGHRSSLSYLV